MEGLDWQTIQIPFGYGRNGGEDPRQRNPPDLAIAADVEFEERGGLQTRHPFAALGSTLADCRRVVANGDELLVFTKTALLSWDAANAAWVNKGTHLAIKVDEESRFVTTGDQINADRAELGGVAVYTWQDADGVYVAAINKATGATIYGPTMLGTGEDRPRLVALETRILLFVLTVDPDLVVFAIDPADVAGSIAAGATAVLSTEVNDYYDVVRLAGADAAVGACRRQTTTSYEVFHVTAGLTVTQATKARTCDGPVAVSSHPAGTHMQVVRADSTNIEGDYLSIAGPFTDVAADQAIGTGSGTINQIAAAHRSVADSGQFRCYAFWSSSEAANATAWLCKSNWVDTGGTLGTQATFVHRLGVASRAFDHDGRVFVWGAFAGESSFSGANAAAYRAQLQNSYFLYRDDATLHAKAAFQRAGGFTASIGLLPGVQALEDSAFAWCGIERRIVKLGGKQMGYGARAPREVVFTFDSNEARRCARLGATLYVTGGEILQYDGAQLVEVGFHVYPWYFGAIEVGTGDLVDGTYAVKVTWRWDNARGERDRSTTATVGTVTIGGGPNGISIVSWIPLYATRKTGVAVEVWRTAVDAPDDAPFRLVSSLDPAALTNPNRFVPNDPTASGLPTFNDELADADVDGESNEEGGTILEAMAPPAASIVLASADRLFLAGVAGDRDRVWYSRQRGDGQVASFHEGLTVAVPRAGGAITALAFLNETLIVFRETAIYALPGDGIDNASGGANFGPARTISLDIGAESMEAVAFDPGGLVFHGRKGKYRLNRGWGLDLIGGAVSDYDSEPVLAIHVLESQHQIRWLTGSRMLVLDYDAVTASSPAGQWSEWSIADGVDAAIWGGQHAYLATTGPKVQRTDHTGIDFGLDVETAWIKMADLQGAGRVRRLLILGELRGACHVRVRIARDYETAYFFDKVWPAVDVDIGDLFTVGGPLQIKVGPSIQRCQAIKVRITAVELVPPEGEGDPTITAPATEALKLTGIGLEVGINRGLHRRVPASYKV